jgi:hypothetical protein
MKIRSHQRLPLHKEVSAARAMKQKHHKHVKIVQNVHLFDDKI